MDIRTQDADTVTRTSRTLTWAAVLLLLFAFRLGYGLSQEFFFEDETQIFLMGLRYYATVAWPFLLSLLGIVGKSLTLDIDRKAKKRA